MKQKDIALILIVAIVSVVVAILASNFIFSFTGGRELEAESADTISSSFTVPGTQYYNNESVNPTQIIRINNNENNQPFNNED